MMAEEPKLDEAMRRALADLNAMAEEWFQDTGLSQCLCLLAGRPLQTEQLIALTKEAFIAGAIQCWLKVAQ